MQILLINAVMIFSRVLQMLVFVRIVASWLPFNDNNPIMQLLYAVTEPVLSPVRKLMYKSPLGGPGMMLDFSPVIAVFLIQAVSIGIVSIIHSI